jgi:hypothetical protein
MIERGAAVDDGLFEAFMANEIHEALAACSRLRPSVDISIVG